MLTVDTFIDKYNYHNLDAQQKEAVGTTEGPILLLAVPGSGKTTTLLARLGFLVYGKEIPPEKILTCTYTVAATNEMRARFRAKFGDEMADKMEFRTINGVCARIIRMYERQGHQAFDLVQDGVRNQILRKAWMSDGHGFPTEFELRSMSKTITYIKNQMIKPDQVNKIEFSTSDGKISIGPIYRKYQEVMRQNHWMDYDDQMVYARIILLQNPGILQRLQDMYWYFCVDEAQDTSKIQHQIIRILAQKSRNLLMVGDEDQSIYGFRAACPEALMNFENDWTDAKVLFMEQNYRSTPQIVSISDKFIKQNHKRRDKKMHAIHGSGKKIEFEPCSSRLQQYERLTQIAEEVNAAGKQTAVLYRNNDTILPIVDELTRKGIPYQAKGVDGLFFTHKITLDICAFFRFILHPDDRDAFLLIYSKMSLFMKRSIAQLEIGGNGIDVLDAYLKQPDNIVPAHLKDTIKERKKQFEKMRKRDDPTFAITCICKDMGYRDYLDQNESDTFRLDILSMLAKKEKNITDFLNRLDELREIIRSGGSDPSASFILSTIHSSKGLEYDRVILADVVEGVMPDDVSKCSDPKRRESKLEEDRRLFYVGMTRAKKELIIMDIKREASSFVFDLKNLLKKAPDKKGQKSTQNKGKIKKGDHVIHDTFGEGIVINRDGRYADITFLCKNSTRTIDLIYAIDTGILKKA